VTSGQIMESGLSRGTVRGLIRRGQWTQQRRDVVSVIAPECADEFAAISATAAALSWRHAVISHQSAAVLHGLPMLYRPGRPILTVTQNASTGRRAGIHTRRATLGRDDVQNWHGAAVTSVPRTILDVARHGRLEGLVMADAALRLRLCTHKALDHAASTGAGWPGVRSARWVAAHATPLAESPLESLIRACLIDHGVPLPELQAWIELGQTRFRVDGLWREQGVVLEADGKIKYASAEARGDALWAEKRRQEQLEQHGLRVVRASWAEVTRDQSQLVARIRRALGGDYRDTA